MSDFRLEGENAEGKPKWLTFQCQASLDAEDRCRVSINGQRNGSGATWSVAGGAEREGPIEAPTVTPSVHCVGMCHFHINAGRFTGRFDHCGDYPKRGGR